MSLPSFQSRLYGGGNRIKWAASDVARIASHMGINTAAVPMPEARSAVPLIDITKDGAPSDKSYTFTISTPAVDRMGDTIAVSGWKLDAYRKNPVVLWGHFADLLPIGSATRVWAEGNKLKASMKFANSQYASRVRDMVQSGTLKATSVGFIPLKFAFSDDPKRKFGIDFLEQELIEFSIVAVPANSEALIDAGQAGNSAAAKRQRELDLIKVRAF